MNLELYTGVYKFTKKHVFPPPPFLIEDVFSPNIRNTVNCVSLAIYIYIIKYDCIMISRKKIQIFNKKENNTFSLITQKRLTLCNI